MYAHFFPNSWQLYGLWLPLASWSHLSRCRESRKWPGRLLPLRELIAHDNQIQEHKSPATSPSCRANAQVEVGLHFKALHWFLPLDSLVSSTLWWLYPRSSSLINLLQTTTYIWVCLENMTQDSYQLQIINLENNVKLKTILNHSS